jgi:hypothetical protein
MNEAENLFGDEHVRRYRETDAKVGHTVRIGRGYAAHAS